MEREMRNRSASDGAFLREIYRAFEEELAAVSSYAHAAILASNKLPSAARLFDELARVELAHHEELGQLLLYLSNASLPYVIQGDARTRQWGMMGAKGRNMGRKNTDSILFLEEAIEDEKKASANYRRLAELTSDDTAHKLLLRISAEEREHEVALSAMRSRLSRS